MGSRRDCRLRQANQWDKRVAQLLRAYDSIIDSTAVQPELAVK